MNQIFKTLRKGVFLEVIALVIFASSIAFADEYRSNLTPEETKNIWLKSCASSLFEAQSRYGSKISFPSNPNLKAALL